MYKKKVIEFLKKYIDGAEIEKVLNTKNDVFAGMTATEFAELEGWRQVHGIFMRIYA